MSVRIFCNKEMVVDVISTESETKNHSSLFIISAVNGEKII